MALAETKSNQPTPTGTAWIAASLYYIPLGLLVLRTALQGFGTALRTGTQQSKDMHMFLYILGTQQYTTGYSLLYYTSMFALLNYRSKVTAGAGPMVTQ